VSPSRDRAPEPAAAFVELERCLAEVGYTPPLRALPRLVRALAGLPEDSAIQLERALVRAGAPGLQAAIDALESEPEASQPALLSLLARGAAQAEGGAPERLLPALLAALTAPRAESRKLAARGLGKLGDARAEPALLTALELSSGPEQKAIVDALGALGGAATAARLAGLESADADLQRRRQRSRLMIERRLERSETGVELDATLGGKRRIAFTCRAGLEGILAAELEGAFRPLPHGPGRVDVEHGGSLRELLVARTALEVALVLRLPARDARPAEQRIADALTQPDCLDALARWTRGVPRFRVAWLGAGHRRALSWALARAVRERTTSLVNDPRAAAWTVHAPPDGVGELLLRPRLAPDPRFAYRRADVPAASHPTVAAALARHARLAPDDIVWDPFVGSGLELIESARVASVKQLYGTDLDPRALDAARANLEAAGVHAELGQADALDFVPPSAPTVIISNPPMGRRVARDGSLGMLLDAFLEHAARVLRPGGRVVWLSPLPERSARRARELGFHVESGPVVDMGGFTARLQRLTRPH
jgi:predicted RNA methylase